MVVPRGSIVSIKGIGEGVLSEDVTISLSTTFKDMFSGLPETVTEALKVVTTVGTLSRATFGIGFSGQFMQATAQMWDKTDPASFSINVDFHRIPLPSSNKKNVSAANMMETIKKFCSQPLPRNIGAGVLEPPGPSIREGIGFDALKSYVTGKDDGRTVEQKGIVDVTIGKMQFKRLLMKKAEPTFSKYTDDSEYPISCRVSFEFVSLWAATKNMVWEWSK